MNFDRIAPFYDFMESWVAGRCLHRCRTAFLDQIAAPGKILLVGEGHGRFLPPCRLKFPEARIVVLDGSAKMLEISKRRLPDHSGVEFIHSMIEDWQTAECFDLIVTNFMLDCVEEAQIRPVIGKLSSLGAPTCDWLIADFEIAPRGPAKWRSRIIIRLLYIFFRSITRIPAGRLHPPDAALTENGFTRHARRTWEWGMLKSEWWRRRP